MKRRSLEGWAAQDRFEVAGQQLGGGLQLLPRDPDRAPPLGGEAAVASAIALERGGGGVEGVAVELDGHAPAAPDAVALEPLRANLTFAAHSAANVVLARHRVSMAAESLRLTRRVWRSLRAGATFSLRPGRRCSPGRACRRQSGPGPGRGSRPSGGRRRTGFPSGPG